MTEYFIGDGALRLANESTGGIARQECAMRDAPDRVRSEEPDG